MASSKTTTPRNGTSGDFWEKTARSGYAVSGALHLILGWLIVRIALGVDAEADQSSALSSVQDAPLGTALLWVAAVAFAALGSWQAADAMRSGEPGADRAKASGKALLYAALAISAARVAVGASEGSGEDQAEGLASTLMHAPAGRVLVAAIGLGIIAGAVFHVFKGVTRRFVDDLRALPAGAAGTAVKWLGIVGYAAKGVALAVVGILFTDAAVTADPDKASGIDGAVDSLLGAPAGPAIVGLVGAGFAAYGLYSFARARYARM